MGKYISKFLILKILKKMSLPISLIVIIIMSLQVGASLQKEHFWGKLKQRFQYDANYALVQLNQSMSDLPVMVIDIKHKSIQKILKKRDYAVKQNVLITSDDDFVPAKITINNQSTKVRLRLKGDGTDHIRNAHKMSFRIKTRGEQTVLGMKKFSIHHPKTRNYVYEWLFHEVLRKENILSVRYHFVNVVLNGKKIGIYAVEEHFDKRLVEYGQRKEGPIIKFSENPYMRETIRNGLYPIRGYLRSRVDAFQKNRLLKDPTLTDLYMKAVSLLEAFREGDLSASEVFDIKILAKYYAISDLFGAFHGNVWNSERFYYNPITSRLEPVGFDANAGDNTKKHFPVISHMDIEYQKKYIVTMFKESIFEDKEFISNYIKELERVSQPAYLREYLNSVDNQLGIYTNALENEFLDFKYSEEILLENQQDIFNALNPQMGLRVHFENKNKNKLVFEVGNQTPFPIEIIGLKLKNKHFFKPIQETVINRRRLMQIQDYTMIDFLIPENIEWHNSLARDLKINYRFVGIKKARSNAVCPIPRVIKNLKDKIIPPANISQFSFITINEDLKKITFIPGEWEVSKSIIIPPEYKVYAEGGVVLNFINQANFISQSPLEFVGTEDFPIEFNGSGNPSGGVLIINTSKESYFKFVHFKKLSSQKGLSGAVTFYKADVTVQNSMFSSITGESLNIIKSKFVLDKTLFESSSSNSFNSDYSKGDIRKCTFVNSHDNAMLFLGSAVEIEDTFVSGVKNIAIRAEELSNIFLERVIIKDAETAVVSTNMSRIEIRILELSNSNIGFLASQKKPKLGPAIILGEEVIINNVVKPYLVEENSFLQINDKKI